MTAHPRARRTRLNGMGRLARRLRGLLPWRGLATRQLAITLGVALLVGLASGAIELLAEWHVWRDQVRQTTDRDLDLVRASAAEAAFQLNVRQADNVAAGLLNSDEISHARLRDNFGNVLAERSRAGGGRASAWLGERLLDGLARRHLVLAYLGPGGGVSTPVGQLDITLDAAVIGQRFLDLVLTKILLGMIWAALLSLLLAVVFYATLLRPLVALSRRIVALDPAAPARAPLPAPKYHADDEFGELVRNLNALLEALQRGLEQRDQAEAALGALDRTLAIIALGGDTREETARHASGDIDDTLDKPIVANQLIDTVEHWLADIPPRD